MSLDTGIMHPDSSAWTGIAIGWDYSDYPPSYPPELDVQNITRNIQQSRFANSQSTDILCNADMRVGGYGSFAVCRMSVKD